MGRDRTSEICRQVLNLFAEFRNNVDLSFPLLDSHIVEEYEVYLKNRQLCRNIFILYENMHSVYNKALHGWYCCSERSVCKRI